MMHKLSSRLRKGLSGVMTAAMIGSLMTTAAFAETSMKAGTYEVDATLSCYVNAMGGVEFSDGFGLLTGSTVTVNESGAAAMTLELGTTSGLSVYGVPCTAFIGTDEDPGYYDKNGEIQTVTSFKVSDEKVANANGEVNYIESLTFPVEYGVSEYTMYLYLDSNVMGCQLGDGSGTGASNTPGVLTKHTSKLTIDWDSLDDSAINSGSESGSENNGSGNNTVDTDVYSADMELSCYVNAMGGIEFAADGLFEGNSMKVIDEEAGSYNLTLKFGKTTGLNIYGVDCTAFIGTEEDPGYYENGVVKTAEYTLGSGTVTGPNNTSVEYVNSMTFPVNKDTSEYHLWLYVNSNVMGCQFGDGSGSGSSNNPGVSTPYEAVLTIDWSTLKEGSSSGSTSSDENSFDASATIEYVVEETYSVDIPSTITVDSSKVGKYEVTATSLPEGGYMTISADASGKLKNESGAEVEFTNTLTQTDDDINGNKLTYVDGYLDGTVTVTGKASSTGKYTGTLNFEIACH